ncbi:MAG: hypothetical protein HC845_13350, partial [Akkermansiaceae bacterium]|nr:hypothetical protein [Akkermansiaceae bacterium]
MKPKRFYFRGTPLFSIPLRYGAPVFVGFTVLLTGLNSEAAIYGAGPSGRSSGTPATPAAGGKTPAAANAARQNAKQVLARTNRAVGAAAAMQKQRKGGGSQRGQQPREN